MYSGIWLKVGLEDLSRMTKEEATGFYRADEEGGGRLSLPSSCALTLPWPTGDWDTQGCSTELGDGRTVCRCDHLTFFALLLVTAHAILIAVVQPLSLREAAWAGWVLGDVWAFLVM